MPSAHASGNHLTCNQLCSLEVRSEAKFCSAASYDAVDHHGGFPFSLVGILPAHGLLHAFFTATSMIGFIAGAGIVVRNSIILVDFSSCV